MLAKVCSAALVGVDAVPVDVEADVSFGLPAFAIAGLADTSEQDARERIRAAIKNSGADLPQRRIVISLAPADLRKEGASFDLPAALALLIATGQLPASALDGYITVGELSLDGRVRPVAGVLAVALLAKRQKCRGVVVSEANAAEAALARSPSVMGVASLAEAIQVLTGRRPRREVLPAPPPGGAVDEGDFNEVKGQAHARRALLIAAAGNHHTLLIGPPGSGKTMLARRLPTILPPLQDDEGVEVTTIHSVAGLILPGGGLLRSPPFRAPHHSISRSALMGGGPALRPGEVTLAHRGVLFLDELPEFHRDALEALRQPLEEGTVSIARVHGRVAFPARFMLAAAMNPCPCGYFGDRAGLCRCTPPQVARYIARVSGPLLDRIDLHVDVPRLSSSEVAVLPVGEASATLRAQVRRTREHQRARFARLQVTCNAEMTPRHLRKFCRLDDESATLLRAAVDRLHLSARAYDRILRIARTIADLADAENIMVEHVAEAVQYRGLDRQQRPTPVIAAGISHASPAPAAAQST